MKTPEALQSDPHSRPRPFSFYPPRPNPFVIAICKWITPMVVRRSLKVVRVDITDEDLARLAALKGRRSLILPSHSGGFEFTNTAHDIHRVAEAVIGINMNTQ